MPLAYNTGCVLLTTHRNYTEGKKCPKTKNTHSPGCRRDYRGVFIKSCYWGYSILTLITFISSVQR